MTTAIRDYANKSWLKTNFNKHRQTKKPTLSKIVKIKIAGYMAGLFFNIAKSLVRYRNHYKYE